MDLPEEIGSALKFVAKKLSHENIKWILVGSAGLCLQGVDIRPNDLDILTDKDGAYEIGRLFREFEIQPVKYSESEEFASHIGKFNIENISVEVMGDLKIKHNSKWKNDFVRCSKNMFFIDYEGFRIPVSSLKIQVENYKFLGRWTKAKKIEELLKQ